MNKKYLGVMVDCSRNAVLSVSGVKRLIDCLEKMGYNMLMLYTEDTYEVDNQPKFGYLRGRYTKDEMKNIVAYGEAHGIEMIPCIQTLAHLNQIFRYPEYQAIRDCDDILLADDDRTYALIEDMFKTLRECYKTNLIHIGMDEAHNLGKGKYRDIHGDTNRFEILKKHLDKVAEIAKKYGFNPMMWSDMFFRLATGGNYYSDDPSLITPEVAACVPDNVDLVYWDYYSNDQKHYDDMIESHKRFNKPVWFAGGAWTWTGFTPKNKTSVSRTATAMRSCREHGVENIFLTCWGDDGGECSVFSILPTLFYGAEVYRGNEDEESVKLKFKETFGIAFDDFMKLDLPNAISEEYSLLTQNIDRTLVYNDILTGRYDNVIARFPDIEKHFADSAKALEKLSDAPEFGYLFEEISTLCKFLSFKVTLGIKIREAYKSGDKSVLKTLCDRIKSAEDALEEFYFAYRTAWLNDKKGSGLEVQDVRLGGLKMRLTDARLRISDYVDGKIEAIDDLEQELLEMQNDFNGFWGGTVTTSII